MDQNLDYLLPGFDPTNYRVADLRRILLFHNIDYPSSARKTDLVKLFLQKITPNAQKILNEIHDVVPSCEGIEFEKNKSELPQVLL